jgi:hypothetical protein
LDVITRLLRPGDEVVTGDDLYGFELKDRHGPARDPH